MREYLAKESEEAKGKAEGMIWIFIKTYIELTLHKKAHRNWILICQKNIFESPLPSSLRSRPFCVVQPFLLCRFIFGFYEEKFEAGRTSGEQKCHERGEEVEARRFFLRENKRAESVDGRRNFHATNRECARVMSKLHIRNQGKSLCSLDLIINYCIKCFEKLIPDIWNQCLYLRISQRRGQRQRIVETTFLIVTRKFADLSFLCRFASFGQSLTLIGIKEDDDPAVSVDGLSLVEWTFLSLQLPISSAIVLTIQSFHF